MADEPVGKKKGFEALPPEGQDPPPPWTYAKLVERYGPEGGEEIYRRTAVKYGHFDPAQDTNHRPDLAPPA